VGRAIGVAFVHVCTYHPGAKTEMIEKAAQIVRDGLKPYFNDVRVYATERARKPSPLMLRAIGASCYYGDDDCDRQAAKAAGITFYQVERFTG